MTVKDGANRIIIKIMCVVILITLVSACDRAQMLRVTRPDFQPISCENQEPLRYTVTVKYNDGKVYSAESYDNEVASGWVPGWEKRIKWIQFTLYCGDSKEPIFVTKRIKPDEFTQKDEWNFYYFIDELKESNLPRLYKK